MDRPFLDQFWIREQRHRHQVPDRRGRTPGAPIVRAKLRDGRDVLAILDRGGWRGKLIPAGESGRTAKTLLFTVDADDEQAVERKREKLERDHEDVEIADRTSGTMEGAIEVSNEQSTQVWPRMGAKVALAVSAIHLDERFIGSPAGTWLRDVLWGNLDAPAPPGARSTVELLVSGSRAI